MKEETFIYDEKLENGTIVQIQVTRPEILEKHRDRQRFFDDDHCVNWWKTQFWARQL